MFKCKYCGREFEKKQQLAGHIVWCEYNPNRNGKSGFVKYNKLPKKKNVTRKSDELRDDLFCQYCGKQCKNINSLRTHEVRCKQNPNRIPIKHNNLEEFNRNKTSVWNKGLTKENDERIAKMAKNKSVQMKGKPGRPLTDEEKKNLSIKRTEYLKKNGVNRWSNFKNRSYAEKYFENAFNNTFEIEYHIKETPYTIDFADIENKVAIEIDGEQHYISSGLRKEDIKRDNILFNLGWKTIRIRWSEFTKLSKEKRKDRIDYFLNKKYLGV